MVVATVSGESEEFKLKTLPGGYVKLRRMSYGQKLTRMQTTTKMSLAMKKGQKDVTGNLEQLQLAAAASDFRTCVTEHNLTDANERRLDFSIPSDMSALDPRVGEEIASLIDKMNNFEEMDEEDVAEGESGNLLSASA